MNVQLLTFIPLSCLEEVFPSIGIEELLPHLSYTFAIEKISRVSSHQLVRHRVASFSQQSQRYIRMKRLRERVVVPPSINDNEEFYSLIQHSSEAYQKLVDLDVPKEDARFVLPNAAETSLLLTMDGRSMIHFLGLRTCNRAQWEIRMLGDSMLEQLREVESRVFNKAGPYCFRLGYCPEGKFTCGHMKEVLEMYSL